MIGIVKRKIKNKSWNWQLSIAGTEELWQQNWLNIELVIRISSTLGNINSGGYDCNNEILKIGTEKEWIYQNGVCIEACLG